MYNGINWTTSHLIEINHIYFDECMSILVQLSPVTWLQVSAPYNIYFDECMSILVQLSPVTWLQVSAPYNLTWLKSR